MCPSRPADAAIVGHPVRVGEVRDLWRARSARVQTTDHELALAADPQAPRVARHWMMRVVAAAGIGGTPNQVIEVLTAELVADAVRVARDSEHVVLVTVRIDEDAVRVAVTGPGDEPPMAASMALVEVLSSSWGAWPSQAGTRTVWFDVRTAS